MEQALDQVETLLRRYGHAYEANLASIARRQFVQDPQAACRAINTSEWWEDRHSIAAVDLAIDGGFTPQARRDAQDLRSALTLIFTTMLAYGEQNDAGEIVVSQFQKWSESRI
jgi:hypothetical protein